MILRVARALLAFLFVMPLAVPAAEDGTGGWALSAVQMERLGTGAILSEGEVAADRAAADIRAAVQIEAPADRVFQTLTDCAQALKFVPHLKRCAVLDTAKDESWQHVEHYVDYGWLAPRANYVFRADYDRFRSIRFSHIRGDFRENRGMWQFLPVKEGRATIAIYQARLEPDFFVPRWMMRSMMKRDLPELMRGLRQRVEGSRPAAPKSAPRQPPT
jgi:ribosome-associated toxin RatA of RatAB toxin-antitoxin module